MKDKKIRHKLLRSKADEHLGDYLKATYTQRLAWLEKAVEMQRWIKTRGRYPAS